jgi:thymidylate kinase
MNKLKIGIIGTHYSGKTALCHQVVGQLRSEGFLIDYVREAARNSYYLASGVFNYAMQLDILNRQISEELEILRTSELVICDRTVLDVLAYSCNLPEPLTELESIYKKCIEITAYEFLKTYDILFLKTDYFDTLKSNDGLVQKDNQFQNKIFLTLKSIIERTNLTIIEIDSNNGLYTITKEIKQAVG